MSCTVHTQRQSTEQIYLIEQISVNQARITKYLGPSGDVRIPQVIEGMTVTEIGDEAFLGKEITKITFPQSLRIIGTNAFKDNKLTEITIPVNVTSIGIGAFRNNRLNQMRIPFNIRIIEAETFVENPINRIIIGSNVNIAINAFDNRFASVYIHFGKKAGTYTLINNMAWRLN